MAIKVVKSECGDALDEFLKEISNHPKLENPFLLKLLGFCVDYG